MCCRHSLAGSKQGKSRDCSRSGSKQQRRQERHFLVPTSHMFFQRRPDCRARAQGIVGVLIPSGPRFKIELVGARSREHGARHNAFSCREKTVASRRAASYRRGLVSAAAAAAARPLPRRPSPTRKPGADAPSPGARAPPGNARKLSAARPPACARPRSAGAPLHLAESSGGVGAPREWARKADGNPSRRWRGASPQPTVVSSILHVPHYHLPAGVPAGRTTTTLGSPRLAGRTKGFVWYQGPWMSFIRNPARLGRRGEADGGKTRGILVGLPPRKCTTRFLSLDGSRAGKENLQDRPARVYLSQGTGWVSLGFGIP